MKSQQREILKLEAELFKLAALVRERRKELDRLQKCPNHTCQCRFVWNQQVNKTLATQVRKIRQQIGRQPTKVRKPKVPA